MGFLDRFFQPKTMSVTNTPEVNEEEIRQRVRERERQQAAEWLERSGMREPRPEEVSTMDMNEPEPQIQEQRQMASMGIPQEHEQRIRELFGDQADTAMAILQAES